MKTSDFDYYLPLESIAQHPLEHRDRSRLMLVRRNDGSMKHSILSNIADHLIEGDVLVFNDSRVIPARFYGRKVDTGGKVEILLVRHSANGVWEALVKPSRRVNIGDRINITSDSALDKKSGVLAKVEGLAPNGIKLLSFYDETALFNLGSVPLPPYIRAPLSEPERYQTVYANKAGSVAAPTAGLHFTKELLGRLGSKGIECLFITLHIGLDTFRPVNEADPHQHTIYREYGIIGEEAAEGLSIARQEGRRIICVGTTPVRLLEHTVKFSDGTIKPFSGWVDLFILPGHHFRMVDGMITNFHLPRSTLLMLVSAFGGRELIMKAYSKAILRGYRFYSFGDAMLIL
ncbi:MAG: tRNA preQ1(34) S-adenosylmethionine ribosyltransferase-isomerase QueA [Dehalococcoidia bacterium]|nr:MAG: tRNA preQ1(34) S-adenosylmethionine ribosyltransferase-isomerase QueA [Dehalococcoidia bacterium]